MSFNARQANTDTKLSGAFWFPFFSFSTQTGAGGAMV
jgi:hypothetical protein